MTAGIQKNINLALILLGCSLPLLAASPGYAQTCTEAEIKANIAKFKDVDSPYDPLLQNVIRCQKDAIQLLIATVQNKQDDAKVRRYVAEALEGIK
ncbi:MAG: hypothetical protein VKK42_20920 [Lyngbya sp.]|nr:hypothetical protein [Lyngbya sp.]